MGLPVKIIVLSTLAILGTSQAADGLVICLLMMARNEEPLLRRHLSSWMPLLKPGGCIVGQVDDRSTDSSHSVFLDENIIPLSVVPFERRHVYHYTFDGLGPARSLLLSEADAKFGDIATHYFIADPDWRFDIAPQQSVKTVRNEIQRSMKGKDELIQAFKIYDRNGGSSRWLDWFVRAKQGLQFKYRWHEMLDVAPEDYTYSILESFTVTETEGGSESYHKEESGGSGTIARFLREIALMEKDNMDYPDDTRVLYYLGVDHSSILSLLKQEAIASAGHDSWRAAVDGQKYAQHWEAAVGYLRKRVWSLWGDASQHMEMAWASSLWLGRCLHDLNPYEESLNDEVIRAYDRCILLDPERIECRLQKVRLLIQMGEVQQAWELAQEAEKVEMPERTFLQIPYHYTCTVFMVGAHAAIANQQAEEGRRLLSLADLGCTSGLYDEPPSFLHDLEGQLEIIQRGGKSSLGGVKSKVVAITLRSNKMRDTVSQRTLQVNENSLGLKGQSSQKPSGSSKPMTESVGRSSRRSAPATISAVVKGIRAVRALDKEPKKVEVDTELTGSNHEVEGSGTKSPEKEFLDIANRWLDLAKHSVEPEDKANLIAKALLTYPSEGILSRLGEVLQLEHPATSQLGRKPKNRQTLLDQLQSLEMQVAALIQEIARTPQ